MYYDFQQWKEKQGKISEQSTAIVHALQENAAMSAPKDAKLPSRDCIHQSFRQLHERFDAEHGGFGSSPKFPQPSKGKMVKILQYVSMLFICSN